MVKLQGIGEKFLFVSSCFNCSVGYKANVSRRRFPDMTKLYLIIFSGFQTSSKEAKVLNTEEKHIF